MADRHRSQDGHKETEDYIAEQPDISQQGRAGGKLARKVGSRDDKKQATEEPAGTTRVTGADKRDGGADSTDTEGA